MTLPPEIVPDQPEQIDNESLLPIIVSLNKQLAEQATLIQELRDQLAENNRNNDKPPRFDGLKSIKQNALFILTFLLTLPVLIALAIQMYVGSYTRPWADDFCTLSRLPLYSIWKGVAVRYMVWSGRFSATFLDFLFARFTPWFNPIQPGLVVVIWLIILFIALLQLTNIRRKRDRVSLTLLWASIILFATLYGSPIIAQSLYWSQGMHSVVPPLILMTLMVAIIGYRMKQPDKSGGESDWMAVIFVISLIAGGFSETFAGLQVLIFATGLFFSFIIPDPLSKKRLLRLSIAGFAGSILALVIVAVAPGNKIRLSFLTPTTNIFDIISIALGEFVNYVSSILKNTGMVAALVGVVAVGVIIGSKGVSINKSRFFGISWG